METKVMKWFESSVRIPITLIAIMPFSALLASSFGIFFYQLHFYAKNGSWKSVAIADLTEFSSLQNNWIGIYKILEWMPASITLFILGILYFFLITTLLVWAGNFESYLIDKYYKRKQKSVDDLVKPE